MSKKHKAMRQGTPIRWDALDRIQKQHEETAAEEAQKKWNSFIEIIKQKQISKSKLILIFFHH